MFIIEKSIHIYISHFTYTQWIELISYWSQRFSRAIFPHAGRKSILVEADTLILL